MSFEKALIEFQEQLAEAFGHTIQKPISVRLGTTLADGTQIIKVPAEVADQPNLYYFHEAGSTSFRGQALLKPNLIPSDQLKFGAPVRIKKDVLSGDWIIDGIDLRIYSEYIKEAPQQEAGYYGYENLAPGLLTSTSPASMQAIVIGASYNVADDWKYIDNLLTVDWSVSPYSDNIPSSPLRQVYVMVAVDFSDETLVYEYGQEVDNTISFKQALAIDKENGNHAILPVPTGTDQFRTGYIRLMAGKTTISRFLDIFPMQDYLTRTPSSTTDDSIFSRIVTADGEVVTAGGEVVYI